MNPEDAVGAMGALGGLLAGGIVMVLVMIVIMAVLPVILYWKIISKTGNAGPIALLMLIPLVNLIVIYWLAFADWPALRQAGSTYPLQPGMYPPPLPQQPYSPPQYQPSEPAKPYQQPASQFQPDPARFQPPPPSHFTPAPPPAAPAAQAFMFCGNCGTKLPVGTPFCTNCGGRTS